jgi:3-oxoacyl-[acyl-carrier-protein] synthase III
MVHNMAQQLPVKIAGLGWYLPEQRVSSAELAQRLKMAPGVIERTTGVLERRYASGATASGMDAAADRMALEHAGIELNDLNAIIGASSAPQQCIPGTAALVQRELQAPEGRSLCFDINATLRERSNWVAASMPLALVEAVHIGRIQRNDRIVLLGTGAGLTVGAIALTF